MHRGMRTAPFALRMLNFVSRTSICLPKLASRPFVTMLSRVPHFPHRRPPPTSSYTSGSQLPPIRLDNNLRDPQLYERYSVSWRRSHDKWVRTTVLSFRLIYSAYDYDCELIRDSRLYFPTGALVIPYPHSWHLYKLRSHHLQL